MKGVNHRVIELHPAESELIETVWVVLRPGVSEAHLAESRQEAERFANALVCWRRRPPGGRFAALCAGALALGGCVWLVLALV